jgi:hypothetical protein
MKLGEDKVLERYRGFLDTISRTVGSEEVIRMHARADCVPASLGSDEIEKYANGKILERLKQSFTEDLRPSMLKLVEDVAHRLLIPRINADWERDLTAEFSLAPEEAEAFERAMRVVAMIYSPLRLVVFDSYGIAPDGYRRRRDVAIVWDGFATMRWTERIRNIRSVLNEPRLRLVGVTQHEVEINAIPGLTSSIRHRHVARAIPPETHRCSTCGARLLSSG